MKEGSKKMATVDEQHKLNVKIRKRVREIICKNAAFAINALDDMQFADEHLKSMIDELEVKFTIRFGRNAHPVMDSVKVKRKEEKKS